jgi:hypothetical protein
MKKILVSIPNTGWIHKHVSMATDRILMDGRYEKTIIRPTHNPYENNLHHIVVDFLKGDYDFWLNIDSDNPPTRNPLDLVKLSADIVGLPTPVWHFAGDKPGERPMYENAYRKAPGTDGYNEWPLKEGLQEVDAVGTGCVLYKRRVFEHPEMQKAPFQRIYLEDGRVDKGNDIAFCERAKKNGFRIFAHYDYRCLHFNEIELHENASAWFGVYNKQ